MIDLRPSKNDERRFFLYLKENGFFSLQKRNITITCAFTYINMKGVITVIFIRTTYISSTNSIKEGVLL